MTLHHRRSIRLPNYDYAQAGAYFLTLVIHNRQNLLGEIQSDTVILTDAGRIVQQAWAKLPSRYPCMEAAAFVVMPNHLHGIVMLHEGGFPRTPISEIVRGLKTHSARRINLMRSTPSLPVWQRNYYEHIIRSEEEMARIYLYIEDNPRSWAEDEENQPVKSVTQGSGK